VYVDEAVDTVQDLMICSPQDGQELKSNASLEEGHANNLQQPAKPEGDLFQAILDARGYTSIDELYDNNFPSITIDDLDELENRFYNLPDDSEQQQG